MVVSLTLREARTLLMISSRERGRLAFLMMLTIISETVPFL